MMPTVSFAVLLDAVSFHFQDDKSKVFFAVLLHAVTHVHSHDAYGEF
jgi:hypothetical protein